MTTNLILVGADKGGVGKTTVTRALMDYLSKRNAKVRAFDTEIAAGGLKRFFGPTSEQADIADPRGQMKILDGITADTVTVVDIRAGLLSPTVRAMTDTGLITDARNGLLQMIVLHVLGATAASVSEVAEMIKAVPASSHILVRNKAQADAVFPEMGTLPVIDVPNLKEAAYEAVDASAQPFETFSGDPANSRVLRGYVRHWLDLTYAEFDRAKVLG